MANKRNYQKELDAKIAGLHGEVPTLLLHSCCAPCSSYVMEYLSQYFEITIFFYNPNITPEEEYAHRVAEIRRLIGEMEFSHPVTQLLCAVQQLRAGISVAVFFHYALLL